MSKPELGPCPPRFVELKQQIAASYPDFEARVTKAWNELLADLEGVTADIAKQGTDVRYLISPRLCSMISHAMAVCSSSRVLGAEHSEPREGRGGPQEGQRCHP